MTAVVDAAHQIVSIAVAFVGNEEGKGREVLVDLAAVVNLMLMVLIILGLLPIIYADWEE